MEDTLGLDVKQICDVSRCFSHLAPPPNHLGLRRIRLRFPDFFFLMLITNTQYTCMAGGAGAEFVRIQTKLCEEVRQASANGETPL